MTILKGILIVISMSLMGCGALDNRNGSGDAPKQVRLVDSRLLEGVESFEALQGHAIGYPVQVGTLDANTVGLCESWESGERVVTISSDYLPKLNPDQLESTIWHELGHCSLNRVHTPVFTQFMWSLVQYPISVMNPYAFSTDQAYAFVKERAHYAEELFKP